VPKFLHACKSARLGGQLVDARAERENRIGTLLEGEVFSWLCRPQMRF
jgi:hypothetical protein